ncbi:MAG: TonB-dependent receptor [Tannerellaceae bacterium]|jgi:TonB-linked SusC/RagA family outer membrane protein|nr:TonB-dependent receptor [Tannerellaceae bacterium]
MRLVICLLLLFTGFVFAENATSQNTRVNLNKSRAILKEVLEEIELQTDYLFISNLNVDLEQRVSVKAKNKPVQDALDELLKSTDLAYSIEGINIILYRKNIPEAMQQAQKRITGTVKDARGESIIGANIIEKGTTNGIITDTDGHFQLEVSQDAVITVSYIGYNPQEISTTGKNTLDIVLAENTQALDEVVVIGYGSVRKSDITGSVSSVKVSELKEGAGTSIDQMLLGKSAGVNVVQNSGEPGGGFSINIRGASSINAGVSPLYVIDGIPIDNSRAIGQGSIVGFNSNRTPRNPMSSINPADIESIEILKDASATAIYGSRGANGVILVTTRSGSSEKMKVSYSGSIATQSPARKLNLLNAADYKRVLNEIIDEGGGDEANRVGDIANNGAGTDWQDEVTRSTIAHEHQLSFSGGTTKTFYYASLNYTKQDGIVKNTSFERWGGRLNLKSDISSKLTIGMNVTGSYVQDHYAANGYGVNETAGTLYSAYNYDPTLPVKSDDGTYMVASTLSIDNPVAILEGMRSHSDSYRFLASAYGEYHISKDLFAKLNLGTDILDENRKNFLSSIAKYGRDNGGVGSNQNGEKSNYIIEGTANYNKTIRNHSFGAMFGLSYQRFSNSTMNMRSASFPDESLGADNLAAGAQTTYQMSNAATGHRLASYIGRVNYSLNDRYLLTATFRADGSSRFGQNNRFGYFPSAAVAWKLSNEAFMEDLREVTSMKLRASWGRTGNQDIGNYPSLSTYSSGNATVWGGAKVNGIQPSKMPNADLKWETTDQLNIGLDFGFFNNRITGGIDYFQKRTTDMLLELPVDQTTGYSSKLSNIGRIDNRGFELFLNTVNVHTRNFKWTSDVTFSAITNEVKDLGGIDEIIIGAGYTHVEQVAIRKPGYPLNAYYGWEVAGIWQENDDFSKMKETYSPGELKYVDQNEDGYINDKDRIVLGNSFPDFSWSFGNTFSYKNVELFVFFDGVQGIEMLNGNLIDNYFPLSFRRNKLSEPYLNRWTPQNPTNEYPSFVTPLAHGRKVVNSKTLSDASYVRLKTIRVGYTLPGFSKHIQSWQVYITAENVHTFTDYIGIDPTLNSNSDVNFRMDFNSYPSARTFMFGVKLDL